MTFEAEAFSHLGPSEPAVGVLEHLERVSKVRRDVSTGSRHVAITRAQEVVHRGREVGGVVLPDFTLEPERVAADLVSDELERDLDGGSSRQ